MFKKNMEIVVFLFPQLNFSAPKEEAYFKMLSPADLQVERKKETKSRVKEKEKKTRLSLLLTKSGSHENVNPDTKKTTKSACVTPEEALKWSDSFEELLNQKDGMETFTKFLKTEFSEENIEFWLACEDYKKTKSTSKLASKAKQIYAVYIESEAPKEINIDFSTKTTIKQNILNPTRSCFDSAQSKVYSLMKKDCYPRFLHSDIYLNLTKTKPPTGNMFRRRSRSCVFNDRGEAETEMAIWL
ncbi:regulator of G-protein signaling 21-like [Lepisosteus oculatus]|uniref:Regulator of G protein signaling 18 n=1 Tax=Lepisosteus oculatus TaxID=7918 RepID=W5MKC5_LEPOC|nr:PREDICTED: regulator of G-protein signaling 21-like [Lepisosteus oculatus]